jgi:hypothetical protein
MSGAPMASSYGPSGLSATATPMFIQPLSVFPSTETNQ